MQRWGRPRIGCANEGGQTNSTGFNYAVACLTLPGEPTSNKSVRACENKPNTNKQPALVQRLPMMVVVVVFVVLRKYYLMLAFAILVRLQLLAPVRLIMSSMVSYSNTQRDYCRQLEEICDQFHQQTLLRRIHLLVHSFVFSIESAERLCYSFIAMPQYKPIGFVLKQQHGYDIPVRSRAENLEEEEEEPTNQPTFVAMNQATITIL